MGEILSSISLLLAIESIALSLWHGEIQECIGLAKTVDKDAALSDKRTAKKRASAALRSKAIPLVLLTTPTACIFTPKWIAILRSTLDAFPTKGWTLIYRFDTVATAYCWILLLSWALAFYAWVLLVRLARSYFAVKRLCSEYKGTSNAADKN